MRILVAIRLEREQEPSFLGDNVYYRPDLEVKDGAQLASALRQVSPTALVTRRLPTDRTLREWGSRVGKCELPIVVQLAQGEAEEYRRTNRCGVAVWTVDMGEEAAPEATAFRLLEEHSSAQLGRSDAEPGLERGVGGTASSDAQTVALVGAGIVNLVTAYILSRSGYEVAMYDGAPDPTDGTDWARYGSTFGGGDGRVFSYTEARQHHYRNGLIDRNTRTDFRRHVSEGGWLCAPASCLDRSDEDWIREFERMPQWLAGRYDQDIVRTNQRGYQGWLAMMASDPGLFADVGHRDRLLRVYSTEQQFGQAKLNESRMGSLRRTLDRDALAREFPSFGKAVAGGSVFGGLDVAGFSVSVHAFGRKLMQRIESSGGYIHWEKTVRRIAWESDSTVAGLQLADGSLVTSDHYVLSPGAYAGELLEGTSAHRQIAGMVGMWLTLPNDDPSLDTPVKVSRSGFGAPGAAEGANVIPGKSPEGREVLHLSSGHGFVGVGPKPLSARNLEELAQVVEETAAVYFPEKYESLSRKDRRVPHRHCVRPWTPSGLGLFETLPTVNGGTLTIAGGHGTGGFAQAPAVAEAVLAAMSGHLHEMAGLYHPRRLRRFCS